MRRGYWMGYKLIYQGLKGDLKGAYARRINIQHRIVYEVFRDEGIVKILRMWTHYE
ncbi:Txe/YoeB family addiction module toxin [Moorella naiadis]